MVCTCSTSSHRIVIENLLRRVMDAALILNNLLDNNAAKRVEGLIVMRKLLLSDQSNYPFRNMSKHGIFEILSPVLDDVRWEVRYQCLLLIASVIQNSDEDIDTCMLTLMPKVISNLGHDNTNIRRASLQVLHIYMKHTNNLQNFLKSYIEHGLESSEYGTRKGCIISVGILFTPEFSRENLSSLIENLASNFMKGDASLFYPIFLAMQKISEVVGPTNFESYLQHLDPEVVNTYRRVLNKFNFNDMSVSASSDSQSCYLSRDLNDSMYSCDKKYARYDFGIFDSSIIEDIKSKDIKICIEGIERMKMVLKDTYEICEKITDVDKFFVFLSVLLGDSNFKVVIMTLSIYDLLIDKFRKELKRFLKTFVSSVARHLGDPKLVLREHAIKVIHKLMHHVRPADVLENLLENKNHRNPRFREEIMNRVTAAVLTFPSYSLEFSVLCESVAPMLVDSKRRVRLAALECFAVLAQAMGPNRLIPLVSAVDRIELNFDTTDGLMVAVQARLARRILPKCNDDGTITYVLTIPSSAGNQNRGAAMSGADIDWIMAAAGSSSSSTPPSRNHESYRESSAVLVMPRVAKSKSDGLIHMIHLDEEKYTFHSNSDEDNNLPFVHHNICYYDSGNLRGKASAGFRNANIEPNSLPNSFRDANTFEQNFSSSTLKSSSSNGRISRQVLPGSKIPVLTRPVPKSSPVEEMSTDMRPVLKRAFSSSGLLNTSQQSHNLILPLEPDLDINPDGDCDTTRKNGDSVARKISPCGSGKPILVRSPSMNQLQQLPNWEQPQHKPLPKDQRRTPTPTKSGMGNNVSGSYMKSGAADVILARPINVLHSKDHVNDINVIVLDDSIKVPSSPSPQSWPSAELFHQVSTDSSKMSGRHTPIISDIYDMCRNSHYSAPASINQDYVSFSNELDKSSYRMTKTSRERLIQRQEELQKNLEERRLARERNQQEHKQVLKQRFIEERERQIRQQNSYTSTDDEKAEERSDDGDFATDSDNNLDSDNRPETSENCQDSYSNQEVPVIPEEKIPRTPPCNKMRSIGQVAETKTGAEKSFTRSSSLKTASGLRRISQLAQPNMRNISQVSKRNLAASSLALFDDESNCSENSDVPYQYPNEALKKALKCLSTETWMGKIEGIHIISRLAQHNAEVLLPQLHSVVLALLTEVKNLRSSVSRSAIVAVGQLFTSLKRNMEQDLDLLASTLLSKSGETVGFIRGDIEKVMKLLVDSVTPNKAALSIIAGGARHRNGAVRKTAAQSLLDIVEKMGAIRILTTAKDVTEKLLPVAAQFLMDCTPMTRYYGRRIFELLMTHPGFDKLLVRYVQPNTLRNISSILESVRRKGAGDMPKDKVSARTTNSSVHRIGQFNRTM